MKFVWNSNIRIGVDTEVSSLLVMRSLDEGGTLKN